MTAPLLSVSGLSVRFGSAAPAVDGLDLELARGETVAVVGESGCGKSTTALALMGLLPATARVGGAMRLGDEDLNAVSRKRRRALRGDRVAMIFQEPMTSLNPVHRIGDQIVEAIRCHRDISRAEARVRALELLRLVRLPDPERRIDDYPHNLSGGQRQRVMIAMAISCEPDLLIADEPTTALDATIQAQILELLDELRRKLGMGLLLITHDLSVVNRWTDRVVVMHHGVKLEEFPTAEMFAPERHAYTRGLLSASIRPEDHLHYRGSRLAEVRVRRAESGDYSYEVVRAPAPAAAAAAPAAQTPLLEVDRLSVRYGMAHAVQDASFTLAPGETLGIVGESGSGKSTLTKAILRLVPSWQGSVKFQGRDILPLPASEMRPIRRHMQMVFQDPFASLNPREQVGDMLDAILRIHGEADPIARQKRISAALDAVALPAAAAERFPHEFSGGQRQRISIARALILRPSLVICDEAVSALDVSIQAQILNLLADLKLEFGLSYLFISHDLAVVQYISDRVVVMRDSRVVETADHETIWTNPQTEYTRALIAASRSDHRPASA